MASLIEKLTVYFQYPFVKYALIAGILIALCSSLLGVTLVLKRFSFIGDGLSHVAFGAMAVATVVGISNDMLLILPVTVLSAIIILAGGKNRKIKGDAAIAMISVGSLAVGYLIMNVFSTSGNVSGDVCSTLFGSTSILTLTKLDVWLCVILSVVVIGIFVLFYNKIFAVTFDEDFAKATGTNAGAYNLLIAIVIAVVMMVSLCACSTKQSEADRETIYQVALLQSLTQGYYDGIIKTSELKKHGDIGIGTFEGVNGEMIVLDGKVYQALGDGSVKEASDEETIPFSNVTFFDKDGSEELSGVNDINALKGKLNDIVDKNGKNMFYFVKIKGTFNQMNVRSELKQEKPYRTLDEALKTDQREFTYDNINGTVVALYCPDYMGGLNTPGWHFHFISDDKTKGGHILELKFDKATVEYDITPGFEMILTNNSDFQKMELSKDVSAAIKKVETNE